MNPNLQEKSPFTGETLEAHLKKTDFQKSGKPEFKHRDNRSLTTKCRTASPSELQALVNKWAK